MRWSTVTKAWMLGGGVGLLPLGSLARALGSGTEVLLEARQQQPPLQDVVTWDDHSLMINGERVMIFSGEVHPFRLPVPGLWADVLQKMKAAGYNCVSVYVDWHLLEAERGEYRAGGNFALEPFFEAAQAAGLYVIARPGPYINAEVSGGGFPGWLTRVNGTLRASPSNETADGDNYLNATELYTRRVGEAIAAAEITKGGPVILFQPENEYQNAADDYPGPFPDYPYWNSVVRQYRAAGVTVPSINNEAHMKGYVTTRTEGRVDIYGHDSYPLGFDCDNPTVWPGDGLPEGWLGVNDGLAPDSPYTIPEFQGGGFQHWGGNGFENCALLLNMEFERVLYKNNYAVGTTIFNIYMVYGGTNYANIGHAEGYTSYDYGAQITEERLVSREKYAEAKLQANFFHVSPAYLAADRHNGSLAYTDNGAVTVTPATTETTKFYISRHTQYDSTEPARYRLTVNTATSGDIQIPQLGGNSSNATLVLNRRDSKIHVSDYPVGTRHSLVYSSAEVFTWKEYPGSTVLVLYGGPDEHHELAVERTSSDASNDDVDDIDVVEGEVRMEKVGGEDGYDIIAWDISDDVEDRKVVRLGSLYIYLLNRNEAYNFWVPPTGEPASYGTSDIILRAGYLIRSAHATTADDNHQALHITGDLNATSTTLDIVGGFPPDIQTLTFNNRTVPFARDPRRAGAVTATLRSSAPDLRFDLPPLADLDWRVVDALPELSPSYDDSAWPAADLAFSPNDRFPITTPTSLYAGDYGFHAGSLLYRGHFTTPAANDTTTSPSTSGTSTSGSLQIVAQGGQAFGFSVWLDGAFLSSWAGEPSAYNGTLTIPLPASSLSNPDLLTPGTEHVITVLVDHMGLNGNYVIGEETLKQPRGILSYALTLPNRTTAIPAAAISWKLTGNLGGESYRDLVRGPLNEGALHPERQGFHLPSPPSDPWPRADPSSHVFERPGVRFYTAPLRLDIPPGYDVPLSIQFTPPSPPGNSTTSAAGNGTAETPACRAQLFVNGYQFGKYVPHIGPQTRFPVPEGVLDHRGPNTLALAVWGMQPGAALGPVRWEVGMVSETGYGPVALSEAPVWEEREGAY